MTTYLHALPSFPFISALTLLHSRRHAHELFPPMVVDNPQCWVLCVVAEDHVRARDTFSATCVAFFCSLLVSKKPNRSKAAHTPAIVACAPPTTPSPPEHPIASGVPSADTYQPVQSSEPPVHSPPIPAPSQEKHYASPPANQHALGFGSQSPRKVMPTSIPTHPTPPQYHRGSKATSVTSEVLSITSYASTSKSKSQVRTLLKLSEFHGRSYHHFLFRHQRAIRTSIHFVYIFCTAKHESTNQVAHD